MSARDWKTSPLKVVNAWLDADNIRLDLYGQGATQEALIHDLFVNQEAIDILDRIARKGYFSHELPIVTKENDKQVVLEGNRRVAALKAAIHPSLVPSYKDRIIEIVKNSPHLPIEKIEVKVALSRAEALPVIAEIHTTASRKKWATLRKAYFYYAQVESDDKTLEALIEEYPGVNIPRFVSMWQMHRAACSIKYDRDDIASKVHNQQKFQISTLERLYRNESFQNAFKIRFEENGELKINATQASFKDALKVVVTDIVNGVVDSRKLNKAENVEKHIARWPKPQEKSSGAPLTTKSFKPVAPAKRKRKSKGLAAKDMVCTIPYPAVERMLGELKRIDYHDVPNAAHCFLRTMLECSLKAYLEHKNVWKSDPKRYTQLNDVLNEAIEHFKTTNRPLVQPLRIIREQTKYLHSADFLNAVHHNHHVFTTPSDVKEAWDQMSPIIRYAMDPE